MRNLSAGDKGKKGGILSTDDERDAFLLDMFGVNSTMIHFGTGTAKG